MGYDPNQWASKDKSKPPDFSSSSKSPSPSQSHSQVLGDAKLPNPPPCFEDNVTKYDKQKQSRTSYFCIYFRNRMHNGISYNIP